ncbi:MAG: Asp-tRNA(Asn)/Glu-tRNA(Gln) amidotransferase subunit GatC [Nevskiales bacterium]|nr:Asp-tRNA(Asn)/Glu-tRNA(Gln) amidotransferase subunit GatC [Nevskiales bacterium]
MPITADQIRQVAQLARLELESGRIEKYAHELSSILELADRLSRIDTTQAQALAHPLDRVQALRPDAVTDPVGEAGRATFQSIAPAVRDGLYLVPKVIE